MSGGPPPASRFEADISSGSCSGHCRGHAGSVSLQEREAVIDRQSSAPEPNGGRPGAGRRRARDGGATAALAMTGALLPVERGGGAGAGAGSDRHSSGCAPSPPSPSACGGLTAAARACACGGGGGDARRRCGRRLAVGDWDWSPDAAKSRL